MDLPKKLRQAVDQFRKLPGVGEKTALRQILMMTNWHPQDLQSFAEAMGSLSQLRHCQNCGMLCDDEVCEICSSLDRGVSGQVCVVESVTDCLAIERSGQFSGRFHILGGVLNPLMGIGPNDLNIDKLIQRVNDGEIKELILAINPSVEGDATCSYISQLLPDSIQADRIGFGIPMGGSLEYLDAMTISKALENRKKM